MNEKKFYDEYNILGVLLIWDRERAYIVASEHLLAIVIQIFLLLDFNSLLVLATKVYLLAVFLMLLEHKLAIIAFDNVQFSTRSKS